MGTEFEDFIVTAEYAVISHTNKQLVSNISDCFCLHRLGLMS